MFINRKSNVSYLKCVAFFSFIRLNNSHISSKVTTNFPFRSSKHVIHYRLVRYHSFAIRLFN
ncbi:hypothetical protein BSR38_03030 [Staphylococcus pseudintermedius]|nr:hypothetical protein BSR38_03030 [Staphylococcus pseudintermedius]